MPAGWQERLTTRLRTPRLRQPPPPRPTHWPTNPSTSLIWKAQCGDRFQSPILAKKPPFFRSYKPWHAPHLLVQLGHSVTFPHPPSPAAPLGSWPPERGCSYFWPWPHSTALIGQATWWPFTPTRQAISWANLAPSFHIGFTWALDLARGFQ